MDTIPEMIFFFFLSLNTAPPLSLSAIGPSILPLHPFIAFLPVILPRQISPRAHVEPPSSATHDVLRTSDIAHRHPYHNEGEVGFYSNELLSDTSSTTQTTGIVRFRNRAKFRKFCAPWTGAVVD